MNNKLKFRNQFIKITASCFLFILAVFLFVQVQPVLAQEAGSNIATDLNAVGEGAGLEKTDPRQIVGNIIKIALGFLGVIAISLVLYGGFLYMTAGGDEAKVAKAKKVLINSFIGLVIVFASYSIASFVIKSLQGDQNGVGGLGLAGGAARNRSLSGGAFGTIIQSQYPMPEQKNVPRNTMIMVTFRLPIDPASVMGAADANYPCPENKVCGSPLETFKVARCEEASLADCKDVADDADLIPGYLLITEDHRTIIFNPYGESAEQNLGSADADWFYVVKLESGIRRDGGNGQSIFNIANPDYKWRFSTGTYPDNTPPKVSSVLPAKDANGVDINSIVVVNFNEPIIPPTKAAQACVQADNLNEVQFLNSEKISVDCLTNHIPGNLRVGLNGYKSVKFISSNPCAGVEKNSCGQEVYCLPSNATITGKILAAPIISGCFGDIGKGITDAAGNSLDGNEDGRCQGPEADNVTWNFKTGNHLDLDPPYVVSLSPANASGNIKLDEDIKALMSESMDPETVDVGARLIGDNFASWFDPDLENGPEGTPEMAQIVIRHGDFYRPAEGEAVPKYTPILESVIQDLKQNCFSPSKDDGACANLQAGESCCPNLGDLKMGVKAGDSCGLPGDVK